MRGLRQELARRMDAVVEAICGDVGKPPMDALAGDVMVTLEQMRFYEQRAGEILRTRRFGGAWPFYSGVRFAEMREAHGVALVCAPWNYPLQLAMVPAATALFAGNAVLLKCSEHAPRTAGAIAEIVAAAGLPQDLVQVFCGMPEEAEALLAARPDFVFFTGSSRNGRAVAGKAAEMMVPCAMELGGKDAALVFASCDLERTVEGLAYGAFANAGQACIGTKRIYVERGIYEDFLRRYVGRVSELRVGAGDEVDLGEVRLEPVRRRLAEQLADAVGRGARLHTGVGDGVGTVAAVLTEVPDDAALLVEESFGPVVCVASFEDEADGIVRANASAFALGGSVWTGDAAQGERVAMRMNCGSCAVNDVVRNVGSPEVGFGGNGASGYGRYHGVEGLRTFTRVRSVMTVERPKGPEVHWFPLRRRTFAQLGGLLRFRHGSGVMERLRALRRLWVLALVVGCGAAVAETPSAAGGSLMVEVTLPAHAHGEIGYLVFAGAEGFPDDRGKALRREFVPVAEGEGGVQRIDVGRLLPGRYAVSVYLDENGNHRLDKNWLGLPKEAVGVSNNAKGLGAPSFDRCAFVHGAKDELISITLVRCCKP
jgi:acyl-CoA reductase-like NAD-dependent aldehyde dehydrogenase/uncharacterized protein (DUF2141 family)